MAIPGSPSSWQSWLLSGVRKTFCREVSWWWSAWEVRAGALQLGRCSLKGQRAVLAYPHHCLSLRVDIHAEGGAAPKWLFFQKLGLADFACIAYMHIETYVFSHLWREVVVSLNLRNIFRVFNQVNLNGNVLTAFVLVHLKKKVEFLKNHRLLKCKHF